ncbi:hypothetical protein CPB83DRAFT_884277 [Crepidotus variabilis]|uniref:Uncharacterized protein n=1 Tax=Crepidotus variabilis TaxID=179855 RepID=A0A9P6ED86_9AGAR|nr:hypothetical protein CPB83DRAFT_884277 [Crepidotus variabilis]
MLRLGKKYEVNHMVSGAVEILENSFPTSLDEFASLGDQTHSIDYCSANLIDIANLALKADLPSVLPCCYLLLSQKLDMLFTGASRKDESLASIIAVSKDAIIRGRERILAVAPVKTLSWLTVTQHPLNASCAARNMWNELPAYFGLPPWEEIRQSTPL